MPRKKRGRGHSSTANHQSYYRPDVVLDEGLPSLFSAVRSPLLEVEDRRLWTPEPILDVPPASFGQSSSNISPARAPKRATGAGAKSPYSLMASKPIMAFQHPKFVAVCVRRKQRREVLLALGLGGGGKRKPRRNNLSNVRC